MNANAEPFRVARQVVQPWDLPYAHVAGASRADPGKTTGHLAWHLWCHLGKGLRGGAIDAILGPSQWAEHVTTHQSQPGHRLGTG